MKFVKTILEILGKLYEEGYLLHKVHQVILLENLYEKGKNNATSKILILDKELPNFD